MDDLTPSYLGLIAGGFGTQDITPGGAMHPGIFDITPGTGPMPPTRADLARVMQGGDLNKLGYSKVKQSTNAADVHPEIINQRQMAPERPLSIEDLYGTTLRGMQSDRSAAGGELAGINGMRFREPVNLQGGIGFPRDEGNDQFGWASNKGAATTAFDRYKRDAAGAEGDVLNIPIGMTNTGADFSHMPAQTLLQMIQAQPPSQKAIDAFDMMMRQQQGAGKNPIPGYPDFPGVMNIDNQYLRDAGGGLRTKFTQGMDTSVFRNAGMPEVGTARYAITDPSLRNAMDPMTGDAMQMPVGTAVRFDPRQELARTMTHGSYDTNIPGEYAGTLPQVPAKVLFGDFMEGKNPSAIGRIIGLSPPKVTVDQQVVDRVMNYLEGRR